MEKCPGSLPPRNLDSVVVPCPVCSRQVELFTDEPKRRCRCGNVLFRETIPRCAEWCPAAAKCLGKVVDLRELEKRREEIRNDPKAKECLERIQDLLKKRRKQEKDE